MGTQVQFRRGTTVQHSTFTGANGEITVDTDLGAVVVHDGATAGGFANMRADFSNVEANTITSAMIQDGTIANTDISAGAVGSAALAAGAIDANTYFAAGVVDAAAIANNFSASVGAGGIDANTKFAVGVVTTHAIAAGAIDAGDIGTGGVSANTELAAGIVTTHAIAAGAIDAGDIGTGGVSANTQLAAGVVTTHAIAAGAIDAGDIGTGGVSANTQLAAGVVTSHAIAAGAIDAGDIGTGGVSANTQLAAGVVTSHAIAAGTIPAATSLASLYPAISGVIETDGTYVAMCLVGPAIDATKSELTTDWTTKTTATTAQLMLATVKDAGADSTVELWNLTDTAVVGGSALASVTITGAATPTSIAAAGGYIAVGHEDGMTIIDPFDNGTWSIRETGWPRSLSTSTKPSLTANDIVGVAAGYSRQPVFDERTGGIKPTVVVQYGSGSETITVLKDDGGFYDQSGGTEGNQGVAIADGIIYYAGNTGSDRFSRSNPIQIIDGDDESYNDIGQVGSGPEFLGAETAIDASDGGKLIAADADGLSIGWATDPNLQANATGWNFNSWAMITRTYNTGHCFTNAKGIWLANSATADRSYNGATLSVTGSITAANVAAGAELQGYSGFSSGNYIQGAHNAAWDMGTDDFWAAFWVKSDANGAEQLIAMDGSASPWWGIAWLAGGGFNFQLNDGSGGAGTVNTTNIFDDGEWHMVVGTTDRGTRNLVHIYVDGNLEGTDTAPDIEDTLTNATGEFTIGAFDSGGSTADTSTISLVRIGKGLLGPQMIRNMYEDERPMFEPNAKCLLQSGTTDAVLDVKIDQVTNKSIVTQTDSVTIWKGLAVESEPTIASGGTTWEHNLLHGDDRVEINDANLAAAVAAKSPRGDLELVRAMMVKNDVNQDRFRKMVFSRDLTTASGKTSVTGVGFRPKSMICWGSPAHDPGFFLGVLDGVGNMGCTFDEWTVVNGDWDDPGTAFFIKSVTASGAFQTGTFVSFDEDGITIRWAKTGSPSGSVVINAMFFG